jgi:RHS repeat-associated protein
LFSYSHAATILTYEYDANGNLISGDGKYFEYNDANQLVRVRQDNASGPVIAEYFYDYTGQRIKKIENGVTTYYIGKHYERQVGGANPGDTSYYFANSERVAKKAPSGSLYFYHSDHLGGTNVITDASGNLVERIKYYPFGEIRQGGNEKYSFTGKEKDKLTDYYYFEARYYNPEFKHFTQADTVAPILYDPQDLNRYAYVKNNPLKYIDPLGQTELDTTIDFIKNDTTIMQLQNDPMVQDASNFTSTALSESKQEILNNRGSRETHQENQNKSIDLKPGEYTKQTGCLFVCQETKVGRTEKGEYYEKKTFEIGAQFGGSQYKGKSTIDNVQAGKSSSVKFSASLGGFAGGSSNTSGELRSQGTLVETGANIKSNYSEVGYGQGWIFGFPISFQLFWTNTLTEKEFHDKYQ